MPECSTSAHPPAGGTKAPTDLDHLIGRNIFFARIAAGMSQVKLAALVGVTFQQIQKYERGTNRISASRLHALAEHLNVPIDWFFRPAVDPVSS